MTITGKERLQRAFSEEDRKKVAIYMTAGYPTLDSTAELLEVIEKSGADIIEIGFPFSDPVADGPTVQHSSEVALANGMSLKVLFDQLKGIREKVSIPLVLMGSFNPVLRYGVESFCGACREVGIDGTIFPDLPPEDFERRYKRAFDGAGLANILLVTQRSSDDRVRYVDRLSSGFLYLVSSEATTGGTFELNESRGREFERIRRVVTNNPLMLGFGIKDRETMQAAFRHADGVIVGSAFIRALQAGTAHSDAKKFLQSLLEK